MNWISNRLAEPSTRVALGFGILIMQQLLTHPPTTAQDWMGFGIGLFGAVGGVVTRAPGSPDNPQAVTLTGLRTSP